MAKNKKSVTRAYGGVLSAGAVRERITRAFLVEEQKVSVDTIEEDAVKAHTRTMSGVNQVTQALRHQKSRTCFMKCVCVFAVVMTLVILFVLLMIKKR